jgi:hypothetical protein
MFELKHLFGVMDDAVSVVVVADGAVENVVPENNVVCFAPCGFRLL